MDFHFRIEFMLQHVSDPECRQYAQKNSTEYWQFGNAQRIWSFGGPHLAIAMIPSLCEKHLQTVLTAYNGCKNMQKIAKATDKCNKYLIRKSFHQLKSTVLTSKTFVYHKGKDIGCKFY